MKNIKKKNYKVRVELKVEATDLCFIEVQASDPEEAKKIAIDKYENNPKDPLYDIWESDNRVTKLDLSHINDWEANEVTDEQD